MDAPPGSADLGSLIDWLLREVQRASEMGGFRYCRHCGRDLHAEGRKNAMVCEKCYWDGALK